MNPASFCNKDSEVFEAINSNRAKWESYFPENFPPLGQNLRLEFSLSSGNKLAVYAIYWSTESDTLILFVPLESHIRRNLEIGLYGLFYTPTGVLPEQGESTGINSMNYLENNIYCYTAD